MTKSPTPAFVRLSSLGIKHRDACRIVSLVEKWKRDSGAEWAVARLKSLKTDLIRSWTGLPLTTPWLARASDGFPKGPIGILFRSNSSFKAKVKALNALMIYTDEYSSSVTTKQWEKFRSSVEDQPCVDLNVDAWHDVIMQLPKPRCQDGGAISLDLVPSSPEKRAPLQSGKTVSEAEVVVWFEDNADNAFVRKLCSRYAWTRKPNRLLNADEEFMRALHRVQSRPHGFASPASVGKISFIQEAGFKLRAVANPNRVIQLILKPLQRCLFLYLKEFDEDCTFDQEKGIRRVHEWLKENSLSDDPCAISAIDLSDATNNFPLNFQVHVLRSVFPEMLEEIQVFDECSKGPWLVHDPEKGLRTIKWSKGQPLGLGPSFAAFAIAHHCFVREAIRVCKKLYSNVSADYVLLGDDIVIRDIRVADKYRELLALYRCPVSESKCITSHDVSEFAGAVIMRDGVIYPIKFREVSDRNFVDIARQVGPSALGLFQTRQRRVLKAISELPEEFGGLGWNPDGIPYEERVRKNIGILRVLEGDNTDTLHRGNSAATELRLHLRLLHKLLPPILYGDYAGATSDAGFPPSTRRSTLQSIIESCFINDLVVPEGVTVPGFRPGMRTSDPRGLTALQRFENKLHRVQEFGDLSSLDP